MDTFTHRAIILTAIAASLLVYLVAVYYMWAGEMTVVAWRIFYAFIIVISAAVFLSRGKDVKMEWWLWKLILALILLAISLALSAFMHLMQR
ncbi:MAG: hypothetical protein FE048_05455 [Thermoplasmata archaeon]|nr:MAG: hypothetical protein FE048_05455 [Thermoplasmata archaeon]